MVFKSLELLVHFLRFSRCLNPYNTNVTNKKWIILPNEDSKYLVLSKTMFEIKSHKVKIPDIVIMDMVSFLLINFIE